MKQTRKGFVEVPTTTLNALKNMLFSADNGVDLSSIINDLVVSGEHKDLMAINVALTYKGVRVNVDERPHYAHEWKRKFVRFDYSGYSLILGVVKVHRTWCQLNEDGTIQELNTEDGIECLSFDVWAGMTTEITDIFKTIEERTK